jgi:hypothetical protein
VLTLPDADSADFRNTAKACAGLYGEPEKRSRRWWQATQGGLIKALITPTYLAGCPSPGCIAPNYFPNLKGG